MCTSYRDSDLGVVKGAMLGACSHCFTTHASLKIRRQQQRVQGCEHVSQVYTARSGKAVFCPRGSAVWLTSAVIHIQMLGSPQAWSPGSRESSQSPGQAQDVAPCGG